MHMRVKVTAEASRERVEEKDGALLIFVKEPRRGNMANGRAVQLAARHLKIAVSQVRLVAGHHAQKKTLEINK